MAAWVRGTVPRQTWPRCKRTRGFRKDDTWRRDDDVGIDSHDRYEEAAANRSTFHKTRVTIPGSRIMGPLGKGEQE